MKTCSTCRSPDRKTIEEQLLANVPLRILAAKYRICKTALGRHRAMHLSESILAAATRLGIAREDSILARLQYLEATGRRLLRSAERTRNYSAAISGLRELVRIAELTARANGELKPSAESARQVTNYVLVFRDGVPKALPEAAEAIDVTPQEAIP